MLRFILQKKAKNINGLKTITSYTLALKVPELEEALCQGGSSEDIYEYHELVGIEVERETAAE